MADLENRVSNLETKVSVIETKIDMFIEEMRDRDNKRAAEIVELRQKQESDMKEIRSTIDSINTKIDGMGKHFRNLTVAAIVGIGAITVSVVGFVITMAMK